MQVLRPADTGFVNFAFKGPADNHLARSVTERYLAPKEVKRLHRDMNSRSVRTGRAVAVTAVAVELLETIYGDMAEIVDKSSAHFVGKLVSLHPIRQQAQLRGDLAELGHFLYPPVTQEAEAA